MSSCTWFSRGHQLHAAVLAGRSSSVIGGLQMGDVRAASSILSCNMCMRHC